MHTRAPYPSQTSGHQPTLAAQRAGSSMSRARGLTDEERRVVATLLANWRTIAGWDRLATREELLRLATAPTASSDLREASRYLGANPDLFERLDVAGPRHRDDEIVSDADLFAIQREGSVNANLQAYSARSAGNDTVYVSRTGELHQYDDAPDSSRARVEHFKDLINSLGPDDTISVEGLSAYSDHPEYLNDYRRAVEELGLDEATAPRLEVLLSGVYPISGSSRANGYVQGSVLLGEPDKFGRQVPDILHPDVQDDLADSVASVASLAHVDAVTFDDHLAIPLEQQKRVDADGQERTVVVFPGGYQEAFFDRHRAELPVQLGTPAELAQNPLNRAWAAERVAAEYARYSDIVRQYGKDFVVSIGGAGRSEQQLVDPARLARDGIADRLEFQVYRGDHRRLLEELETIESLVRDDPESFARLDEIRIALIETADGTMLTEAQKQEQVDAVNAFGDRIRELTGGQVEVGIAYWASEQYFD